MSSYNFGKDNLAQYLKATFPKGSTLLDVGACDGKYYEYLGDHFDMVACEIWEPNIEKYDLVKKYKAVAACNIKDFCYDEMDVVLFGDVIEHMTVQDAQAVLEYAREHAREVVVAVPYMYPQGPIYGNPYEEHLQPDLTHEVFMERYPGFELFDRQPNYGYYITKKEKNQQKPSKS